MNDPSKRSRMRAFKVLGRQSCLLIVATLMIELWDNRFALSVLLGGLIYLLPQTWFTWRALRFGGAGAAPKIVRSFFRAEAGKYLLTGSLFAMVFVTISPEKLNFLGLFGGYIGLMALNIVVLGSAIGRGF